MITTKQLITRITITLILTASALTLGGCFLFSNPHAQFSFEPAFDFPPLAVHFDGSASSSPNGAITDYTWDFDDGSTDTGASVDHTFYDKGTYSVTLTVTDSSGAVGAISHNVEVLNHAPHAAFRTSSFLIPAYLPATFDASESYDEDGEIVDWQWSFGDGTTGIGEIVDHTYEHAGDQGMMYRVTLTVTDDSGKSVSIYRDIQVIGCDSCHY